MAIKLPELIDIDYTTLDFRGIINLTNKLIEDHPEYFVEVNDFTQSNAARLVIELVAYVVDLLAERLDWVANELTLPTATQKQNAMNLLKLINYRLELPKAASVNVTATIDQWVESFAISGRYTLQARDLDNNIVNFELFNKDENGKYIYEGTDSSYEFDTGYEVAPVLSHDDLVFYEGTSHKEFFTMEGINNETVQLGRRNIEEGSIRVYKISRNQVGDIVSKQELPIINSFISVEAQAASSSGLPPLKIEPTEKNGVYLVFGETPVVATFNPNGNDEILVWYRTTVGEVGNIARNAINYTTTLLVSGQNVQITFVNPISASGGSASETLEHAKRYGPLTLSTADKTVNPDDFIILLQENNSIMNSIAFGKSNEPQAIRNEYGYHIPPYETWIYPLFKKAGWESLPTYSYNMEMKVGRPYSLYGLIDTEKVYFKQDVVNLEKVHKYSYQNDTTNILVTDFFNKTQYILGDDFIIDLEARDISRIEGGNIPKKGTVIVQYYENSSVITSTRVNFATGDTQLIPETPINPNVTTYAYSLDLQNKLIENTLSLNDYNYPNNDYYIDYKNGTITKNSTHPYLDSKENFEELSLVTDGVNNEFILNLDGLNREVLNADHDFFIDCYSGWTTIGDGSTTAHPSATYYFRISVDGSSFVEYQIFLPTSGMTMSELAHEIWNNAVTVSSSEPISNLNIEIFADRYTYPNGPLLTFLSKSRGINSSIEIDGDESNLTGSSLLSYNLSSQESGSGEEISLKEIVERMRGTLNSIGLNFGFKGQELPSGEEEKPEILARSNILTPSSFSITSSNNTVKLTLSGTNLGNYDGDAEIIFATATGNTYDLTRYQDRIDLIYDMQQDIDATLEQDIVEVFWIRQPENFYRIGFRLTDTDGSAEPYIQISNPTSNSALNKFQFSNLQSSKDSNLVDALISPLSNMVTTKFIRLGLSGGFGSSGFIKVKANNALHNNTLSLLKYSNNQESRGSDIFKRVLISENELLDDGSYRYTFNDSGSSKNNEFLLDITGAYGTAPDGLYIITIPAGDYNIISLVEEINDSFTTADNSGTIYDISNFMKCEKVEGYNKIRFLMTQYDDSVIPNVVITNEDNTEVNNRCIDKLGFVPGQEMSYNSTIILHYAGNWISDSDVDQSEASSITKFLRSKRLICQDYIVKDPVLTSFDIKGTVYCAKGFDRSIIENSVKSNIRSKFKVDKREFAEAAAISNLTKEIEKVEGTVYTVVDYFGKSYRLYKEHLEADKAAIVRGTKPAEHVVARWNSKSAFKITLDGTAASGINVDGEYLVVVGNDWADRDYDSLLNAIIEGNGTTGGLSHALPLSMGKSETSLMTALEVNHFSGVFEFKTKNEGPSVMIKIEDPDDIFTYGYQNFSYNEDLLETEYTQNATYSINVNINGSGFTNYEINSPASGKWSLKSIVEAINVVLPATARSGIDENNKVRITSLLGGNQSTIDISSGNTGSGQIDLLTILGPIETPVDGSHGYISCVSLDQDASIYLGEQTSYGLEEEPTISQKEEMYNYKNKIPAKYNEILFISDDYYYSGVETFENQYHGIILSFVELGNNE
jgi:hypothetical protein